MSIQLSVELVGASTKTTILDNGKTFIKYGGAILAQSQDSITIRFQDETMGIFEFDQFTTQFGQIDALSLADYLVTNGFFVKASPYGGGGTGSYSEAQVNDAVRRTLTPYKYISYLPEGAPYTTPSIVANTPTKLLIPTTLKSNNGWAIEDIGGGNFAVRYKGDESTTFTINMFTGMTTQTNNVTMRIYMYKNGVLEPGIGVPRKIGTGADVGAMAAGGEFTVNFNDYIEIYVKVDLATTITFDSTSIIIIESN